MGVRWTLKQRCVLIEYGYIKDGSKLKDRGNTVKGLNEPYEDMLVLTLHFIVVVIATYTWTSESTLLYENENEKKNKALYQIFHSNMETMVQKNTKQLYPIPN